MISWKKNYYRVGPNSNEFENEPAEPLKYRKDIEPWLSAVFQSEHLSLLTGNGFSTAIALTTGSIPVKMNAVSFGIEYEDALNKKAKESARICGRGEPNFEDQIRIAINLLSGLEIIDPEKASKLKKAIDEKLKSFLKSVVKIEYEIHKKIISKEKTGLDTEDILVSFLLSFASRTATRERLNIFTTNYDRIIELGCDIAGLRILDRFVGGLFPVLRSSRLNLDIHYNPPGIRGEPRYLEGVVKITKLHGSLDWRVEGNYIKKCYFPIENPEVNDIIPVNPSDTVIVYPNSAKDIETTEYPYAELFRDFSAALCVPNSALITYGYGFGDDHINRVIKDMLTIPSTHLVIISFDQASGRIPEFCSKAGHEGQISLLIGDHFGDIKSLVKYYLPKPAIDQITWRRAELERRRTVHYDTKEETPSIDSKEG